MNKKVFDKEKKGWPFHTFIYNEFAEESKKIKFLFEDEAHIAFSTILKR